MNKFLLLLLVSNSVFSQIGINTETPNATLEIQAKISSGNSTSIDGIIIPNITRERAQNMLNIPESTLVYISDITSGTALNSTRYVNKKGFYFFNGINWININDINFENGLTFDNLNNVVKLGGDLTSDTNIVQGTHSIHFSSTPTTGTDHFKVDDGTFTINTSLDYVGINTINPTANLHVRGDKNDNSKTSTIRFENLPTTNETELNKNITPLYIDSDGNVGRAWNASIASMNDSYTVVKSFQAGRNVGINLFTGISKGVVTFTFNTNKTFGNEDTSVIFGEILFEEREGFKLTKYAVSGASSTNQVTYNSTTKMTIETSNGSLEFNYTSTGTNGTISVKKINGSNTDLIIFIDGRKIRN